MDVGGRGRGLSKLKKKLEAAFCALGDKPLDSAASTAKKRYSELVSNAAALVVASEFRARGLKEARPALPGEVDSSGAERRMAGGIGAKKVDVTWSTEESGLLLAISIKSINFRDGSSKNFQKNLTNRRGDMLFESVTLHRRFPYSVLGGIFFLDAQAESDATTRRQSTFRNAHDRFALFTGREDPAGRDEQYENLFICLLDASSCGSNTRLYRVGDLSVEVTFEEAFDDLLKRVALRNPDFYRFDEGRLKKV